MTKTPKATQLKQSQPEPPAPSDAEAVRLLAARVAALEEIVERLAWTDFYHRRRHDAPHDPRALTLAQDRYVRSTGDGWLLVLKNGVQTALPSGLKVSLTNSIGGRDYGIVKEGALNGANFDVESGNLVQAFRRVSNLKAQVTTRPGGPISIGGTSYELEMRLSYVEGGASKSAGPFPATTYKDNPLPVGSHDVEIADYPHQIGAGYGPKGTVWFRLGHSGDRYLHAGRISAGCLTCAPGNWNDIYDIVSCARVEATTAGVLTFTSTAAVALSRAKRNRSPVA